MQEELNNFTRNEVWSLVERPKKNMIGTKWVFRNKQDEHGVVTWNEARLVAQGFTQIEGIDFGETGLWAEAASVACHLINRYPNSVIDFKILEEISTGKPLDYFNLRIFGCPTYAHVNNGKLVPRAQKYTFIGYSSGVKGYCLLCANSKKVIVSHDVTMMNVHFLPLEVFPIVVPHPHLCLKLMMRILR
jgi:hypothetical protein